MIKIQLKEIMKEKNISIKEIFEETGISRNTISLMVHGKTTGIQFETLQKLLKVLDCDIEELIMYEKQDFNFGFLPQKDNFSSKNEVYFSYGYDKNYTRKITVNITKDINQVDQINIVSDQNHSTDKMSDYNIEESLTDLKKIMNSNHYMYELFSYLLVFNLELCQALPISPNVKYLVVNIEDLSFVDANKFKSRYLVPLPDDQATLTLSEYKHFIENDSDYIVQISHNNTMVNFKVPQAKG